MAAGTAIAYVIMLLLTPFPNVGIISYYNEKPLLKKVYLFLFYPTIKYLNFIISYHFNEFFYNISKIQCNLGGFGPPLPRHDVDQLVDVPPLDWRFDLLERSRYALGFLRLINKKN
jgi:hypothetical protein